MSKEKDEIKELEEMEKLLEKDVKTSEEAQVKLVTALSRTEQPKTQTELDKDEVKLCTSLHAQGDIFNSQIHHDVANYFELLMVSFKRQGRKELERLGTATREAEVQRSKIQRLFPFMNR